MGIGLGLSKSKSKSTQDVNSSGTSTTTPDAPDWYRQTLQGLTGNLVGLGEAGASNYVAGPGALQQQQFGVADQLGAQGMGNFNNAAQMITQSNQSDPYAFGGDRVSAPSAADGVASWMNPFLSSVAAPAMQENERSRQMAQDQMGDQFQAAKAFGGDRQGVYGAEIDKGYDANAQSFLSGLFKSGFDTAASNAQQDAARGLDAGIANRNMDQNYDLSRRGLNLQGAGLFNNQGQFGLNYLANSGAQQQGIDQAQAQAPLDVWSQIAQTLSGLPYQHLVGQTTNETSNTKSKGTGSQFGVSASASYGK